MSKLLCNVSKISGGANAPPLVAHLAQTHIIHLAVKKQRPVTPVL